MWRAWRWCLSREEGRGQMYAKQSSTKRTGVRLTIFPVSPLRAWPNGNWQRTQHALVCMWSCVHMLRNMRHALIQQDRSTHGRESLGGSSKKASPGRFKKKTIQIIILGPPLYVSIAWKPFQSDWLWQTFKLAFVLASVTVAYCQAAQDCRFYSWPSQMHSTRGGNACAIIKVQWQYVASA